MNITLGIILGKDSANVSWRYIVMSSLIGWAHIQKTPVRVLSTGRL